MNFFEETVKNKGNYWELQVSYVLDCIKEQTGFKVYIPPLNTLVISGTENGMIVNGLKYVDGNKYTFIQNVTKRLVDEYYESVTQQIMRNGEADIVTFTGTPFTATILNEHVDVYRTRQVVIEHAENMNFNDLSEREYIRKLARNMLFLLQLDFSFEEAYRETSSYNNREYNGLERALKDVRESGSLEDFKYGTSLFHNMTRCITCETNRSVILYDSIVVTAKCVATEHVRYSSKLQKFFLVEGVS